MAVQEEVHPFNVQLFHEFFLTRHTFILEREGDTGPRDGCVDLLKGDVKRAIERQIERLAQ